MSKKLVASRGMSSNLYLNKPVGGGSKKSGLAPSFLGGAGVSMVRGRSYMGGPKGEQANYKNKDLVFHYKSTIGGIGHNVGGRSLYRMMDGVNNYSLSSTNINKHRKKTIAYLGNWVALPEGVTTNEFYVPLFRNSTHVIVSFVKNHSGAVDGSGICSNTCTSGDGTKCLYFDPPFKDSKSQFTTHAEFIPLAKQINPNVKLLISLGGLTMGCCPHYKGSPTEPSRDFFNQFINSTTMGENQRQLIIDYLYSLIINPDNTLTAINSAKNCKGSWPKPPPPSLEDFGEKIVGIMGSTSTNLGTYKPIPVTNPKSYDGIDIDYEYSWDIDDNKHPVALITNGLHNMEKFKNKELILSHAPFNALFDNPKELYYNTLKTFIRDHKVDFLNIQYYSNPPWAIDICDPSKSIQTNYKNALDVANNDSSKLVFLLATTDSCTRSNGQGGDWSIAGSHTNPKITLSQLYCNIHSDINSLPNLGYWYANGLDFSSVEMSRALTETMRKGCRLPNTKCPANTVNCIIPPTPAPTPAQNKKKTYKIKSGDTCFLLAPQFCGSKAVWSNVICDANTICSKLQIDQIISYNCAGCKDVTPTPAPPPTPAPTPAQNKRQSYIIKTGDLCYKFAPKLCDGEDYSKILCPPTGTTVDTLCKNLKPGKTIYYNCAGNTGDKCNF